MSAEIDVVSLFKRELELCRVGPGQTLAVLTHNSDRSQESRAWLEAAHEPEGPAEETVREVTFERHDEPVPARILWRPALAAGVEIEGPAVIEEANSTTLGFPGDRARITEHGHIDITLGAGA